MNPVRTFTEISEELSGLVEAGLRRFLEFGEGCPPRLAETIQYAVLGPGKRLRPLLVLLACRACGGEIQAALPAACAVELVHSYSLVHDDLPAMDNDDFRRGRPTCHRVFGEGMAILAGDALLARAFEILATEISPLEVAAQCCATLARAAGPEHLVGGQADDLLATGVLNPANVAFVPEGGAAEFPTAGSAGGAAAEDLAALGQLVRSIHRRKTAAMIWASARLGGLVARASPPQLAALESYGLNLGLAFQIVDDILDTTGDPQKVGKTLGKDRQQGKLTYPAVFGLEASWQEAARHVAEACQAITIFGQAGADLAILAHFVLERQK